MADSIENTDRIAGSARHVSFEAYAKVTDGEQPFSPSLEAAKGNAVEVLMHLANAAAARTQDNADVMSLVSSIRRGLEFQAFSLVLDTYQVSKQSMAQVLSIPMTTLHRRQAAGRLSKEESDKVVRYAQLHDQAVRLFEGNNEQANQWLHESLALLAGESPFQHASTEAGDREIEQLIGRIEHGVFS